MIISHDLRFIFIHVQKTGGTSIMQALLTQVKKSEPLPESMFHASITEVLEKFPETKGYFKFAFIRNPWDRLVSLYEFIRQTPNIPGHKEVLTMSFSDFLIDQDKYHTGQLSMVTGLDFIGRYENLEYDFDKVCTTLNLPKLVLPVANKSIRSPYKYYYNDTTQQLVAKKFAKEIETFGYDFRTCLQVPGIHLPGH